MAKNSSGVKSTDLMGLEALCDKSIALINYARQIVTKQVNLVQLMTYYAIGRWVVEEQQNGEKPGPIWGRS